MGANEVFAACSAMIDSHQILVSSRLETWKMLQAFCDLAVTYTPTENALLLSFFPKTVTTGQSRLQRNVFFVLCGVRAHLGASF